MEYQQVTIPCLEHKKDLIIAELSQIGFEGFWEDGQLVNAYIAKDEFNEKSLYDLLGTYGMENSYSLSDLEDKNWNAEWESNFDPVKIGDSVLIRADFHPANSEVKHEIVINPEMSFGTGHHETTSLMIRLMLELNFKNKVVLDLGSGTSVLAILAKKLGASTVVAVENDPGSVKNCRDNVRKNKLPDIQVFEGSVDVAPQLNYDIVLSNITKNINQSLLPTCIKLLKSEGQLLISGFLNFDAEEMKGFSENLGTSHQKTIEDNRWQGMMFTKK
jgi:ribosomal protein L11 methyltransferase